MLRLARHGQFKKDLATIGRRGWDLWELFQAMNRRANEERLGPEYKSHKLSGEYEGFWECHIGGDFLLIWYIKEGEITFVRTGNHADLFGK